MSSAPSVSALVPSLAAASAVLVPDGLAEPALEPRYPQRFAEIMARERPLSETSEARLVSLDELGVGPATAREIGWVGAR
jgi:hypothetical protein